MSRMRFRYALEPVLLTRRWSLDALLLTLGERNAAIAAHAALQADTAQAYQAALAGWQALTAGQQAQSVQSFVIGARYLADLAARMREQAAQMALLDAARDEAIAQVAAAQRAVEAAEQHRDAQRAQFVRALAAADFKLADDQWNTLQAGAQHGN